MVFWLFTEDAIIKSPVHIKAQADVNLIHGDL